jgi:hypothetical protein
MGLLAGIINEAIQHDDICPKCGKHKNGVLQKRSNDFGAIGFRGNSYYECKDGYQTKEEAGLCTCED